MKISIPSLLLIVVLCSVTCGKNSNKQESKTIDKQHNCCNIFLAPEHSFEVEKLTKFLYVGYHKGGEFDDFSLNLELRVKEHLQEIVTSIKIHSKKFNKKGQEDIFIIRDTIYDFLAISLLLDSLKFHDPLKMKCNAEYDYSRTVNEKIDVYYKSEDSTNCFCLMDTINLRNSTGCHFYYEIFNNKGIFKISLSEIQSNKEKIYDSLLTAVEKHNRK